MSLLPFLLDDYYYRPSTGLHQRFGFGIDPEDYLIPSESRLAPRLHYVCVRSSRKSAEKKTTGDTAVVADKDKFQVNLDVQHFKPDEITVMVTGNNMITIEAKHEEKEDEHGLIWRHFVRRCVLPEGHNIQKVESKLSSDGVLTITAPKINQGDVQDYRNIPIQQTGVPSKAFENPKQEEKKTE